MKRFFGILFSLLLLASCSTDESFLPDGRVEGTLVLTNLTAKQGEGTVLKTRAVDAGLAVEILNAQGSLYNAMTYSAGTCPSKLTMEPGEYTLHSYSENQTTWKTDNGGLGSALYDVEQSFTIEQDWTTYLDVQVPMTNYGVGYSLAESLVSWFPTFEFTVSSGGRTCSPTVAQTAYFDPADKSFTFTLHVVNIDGESYTTDAITFPYPEAGHIYMVNYDFADPDDPSKLTIQITYDDEVEEVETIIYLE